MKEQKKIPVGKVKRASRFISTGAKIGGNYVKYYAKKLFDYSLDKEELHADNASDIYKTLSNLKGAALKVAQMMSLNETLPQAYADKFALAQYNAPPLSYPLIVNTFRKYMGKSPNDIFDTFSKKAVNAASIGQIHKATIGNKTFAVKIQYPGVADSVKSDLRILKPFALKLLNITKAELEYFMEEVEQMLIDETDYKKEIQQSIELTEACEIIENVNFPKYYEQYSSEKIITMDWMDGVLMKDFIESNPSQSERNKIGQAIWDFFNYQIHSLRKVHADPHPGNFIFLTNGNVGIIDYGCVKIIPDDFYEPYFKLVLTDLEKNKSEAERLFRQVNLITDKDTDKEKELFTKMFKELISIVSIPFKNDEFDFGDKDYLKSMFELGHKYAKNKEVRKANSARGLKHAIYMNRTHFGLYSILNKIGAKVQTQKDERFMPVVSLE